MIFGSSPDLLIDDQDVREGGFLMKILFAAPENAFGGFLGMIRTRLPQHHFEATGRFGIDTLKGFDVLIPTM
jgi:hypothetical protein